MNGLRGVRSSFGRCRTRVAPLNVVAITVLLVVLAPGVVAFVLTRNPSPLIAAAVVGLVLMQSPRIAQQWERAVVLRLGRFVGLRGPGLFWIVPFVDRVSSWIDQRTITTSFCGRTDAHLRHRAGERRRGAVLDGARRAEGGARSAGLPAGRELGRADCAPRHHRPNRVDRSAARTRAD